MGDNVMTRLRVLLLAGTVLAACIGSGGCLGKATYLPNTSGGYTLVTSADSVEDGLIRLKRRAVDLCGQRYMMTPPEIVDREQSAGPFEDTREGTVQAVVTCQ